MAAVTRDFHGFAGIFAVLTAVVHALIDHTTARWMVALLLLVVSHIGLLCFQAILLEFVVGQASAWCGIEPADFGLPYPRTKSVARRSLPHARH